MARNRRGTADTPKHVALRRAWSERVAQRMEELGLSQIALAEELDCSQSSVSRWFKEGMWAIPEGLHMLQLPTLLRMNGHYMLTGRGPRLPPDEQQQDLRYLEGAREAATKVKLHAEGIISEINLRAPGAAFGDAALEREETETARKLKDALMPTSKLGTKRKRQNH